MRLRLEKKEFNMRNFLFTSLLFLVLPFAAPLSANAVSDITGSETSLIQPRAVQYQVVDRKSQPQVLRDGLWFNDNPWYTYKYISVPNGYRPVGRVTSTMTASTGSNKRTVVSYYSYSYVKN